jgi:hypothetical protein
LVLGATKRYDLVMIWFALFVAVTIEVAFFPDRLWIVPLLGATISEVQLMLTYQRARKW